MQLKGGPVVVLLCLAVVGGLHLVRSQVLADCGVLERGGVREGLWNLTLGLSNLQQFRDLALLPILRPRVAGTRNNSLVRTHIKTWMGAAGWTVREDRFRDATPYGRRFFSNVVATLNPHQPRRVVIACHYDSKLLTDFVGASDSAVPCALMLDAALRLRSYFSSTAQNSNRTIQMIFFDGEEAFLTWSATDSLYGSRHLAQRWENTHLHGRRRLTNLDTIDEFILLDLIGPSDTSFKARYTNTLPTYNKLRSIESCLRGMNYLLPSLQSVFTPVMDLRLIEDDHLPFLQRGVPVVHLISDPFPSVWHTAHDDLQALDFQLIENLARVLRVFLADL